MKYLVTITVPTFFTIEVNAKDEGAAEDKATVAFEKITLSPFDHSKAGKFEVEEGDPEYNVEEAE